MRSFPLAARSDTAAVSRPTLVSMSPANGSVGVAADATLVLTFNEAIQFGAGRLLLVYDEGGVAATADAASSWVSISGKTLTIDPPASFRFAHWLWVVFDGGFVQDAAGNAVADGILGSLVIERSPLALALTGSAAAEVLYGSDLNDTIVGGGGRDVLQGYGGDDRLASGDVAAQPGDGDVIDGGEGNDTLTGAAMEDRLSGGAGNDWLSGGGGVDYVYGGLGDDTLEGGAADDRLVDHEGGNVMRGDAGADRLYSDQGGPSLLDGGADDDWLSGDGQDSFLGGAGNDHILITVRPGAAGQFSRADGGDGDDLFEVAPGNGGNGLRLSGGAGVDLYKLGQGADYSACVVTDFAPGTAGDRVDLTALVAGLDLRDGDPFAPARGYLLLRQEGADAVLLHDLDGAQGTTADFRQVMRLEGVAVAALRPENFGVGPLAGDEEDGLTLIGTDLDEYFSGTGLRDVIDGAGGHDRIDGAGGDDILIGGAGTDVIAGGSGDDWIDGGPGWDSLVGGAGNNRVFGGDGGDEIVVLADGDNLVDGGADDDAFHVTWGAGNWASTTLLYGGAGHDQFHAFLGAAPRVKVVAEGGADSDLYLFHGGAAGADFTITDFSAGAGGDRIEVHPMLPADYGDNPFGPDRYLRLTQRGADTVLELDADGAAGTAHGFRAVAVLVGVAAPSLGLANFTGGIDPGAVDGGLTLIGSDSQDILSGGSLNDRLFGLGLRDWLYGMAGDDYIEGGDEAVEGDVIQAGDGNDTVFGGDGRDYVSGQYGNDLIDGGRGNDDLDGGDGDDTIDGGEGEDELSDKRGDNVLSAGAGNDVLLAFGTGSDRLNGGDDADDLYGGIGNDTLDGGAGDDQLLVMLDREIPDRAASVSVLGGDGYDLISIAPGMARQTLTVSGGQHVDTVSFARGQHLETVIITDFRAGAGGDQLEIWWLSYSDNPFGPDGYLRMVQSGNDTLFQLDEDGAAGAAFGFHTMATLSGVLSSSLTGANMANGSDPHGATDGMVLVGSSGNDTLHGGGFADTLSGGAGDDVIDGDNGHDRLFGGAGDDELYGGVGDDLVEGGDGADSIRGTFGKDTLNGGGGKDFVYGGTHDDEVNGGDGDDTLLGGAGNDTLVGGIGNDRLGAEGGDPIPDEGPGTDVLDGGAGNDTLDGGAVAAQLNGGSGDDVLSIDGHGDSGLYGGSGRDLITIAGAHDATPGRVMVAGGADDDTIVVARDALHNMHVTASGGAGVDTYVLRGEGRLGALTVKDFTPGGGGDRIDVSALLTASMPAGDALVTGVLRLVQSGSATLVQLDPDGAAADAWAVATLLTLQDVVAGTLSAANLIYTAAASAAAMPAPLELVGVASDHVAPG